jgi:hypothetical protein
MERYHIFFLILKTIVGIHLCLILLKLVPSDDIIYLINESIFKFCIGCFLGFYFLFSTKTGLIFEDRLLISVAGFVILYDIKYVELFNKITALVKR